MNETTHRSPRQWWMLATLSLVQLMVVSDVSVINIALPQAQISLGFSTANRQWLITAYALSFGSLMLVGGRLSDIWGRRTSLLVGLSGFAAASVVGGVAHHFTVLVAARAAQGVFAALLAPAALAALATAFQETKARARAFTVYGTIAGAGASIGLLLGGALTQYWSWRWCLHSNVVVALVALVGVLSSVPHDHGRHSRGFDPLGALTSAGGLFLVVYGFANAVYAGWSNTATWASLVGGGLLLGLFLQWQRRAANPLVSLATLTQRSRSGSLIALFLTSIGMFGLSLFLAYYLENVLHNSPLRTGLLFLPLVIALVLSSVMASARLLGHVGPRALVPVGMVLGMMGMVLFTRISPSANYAGNVLPGLVLTGLGLGLIVAPAVASATSDMRVHETGVAAAVVNTSQQIGGSVGTALLNTIAVSSSRRFFNAHPATTQYLSGLVHGYHVAFWWAAGFFAVGAITTFFLLEMTPSLDEGGR